MPSRKNIVSTRGRVEKKGLDPALKFGGRMTDRFDKGEKALGKEQDMQIQTRAQCGKCGKPTAHNLIDFVMDKAIVECRECLCVSMRSRREVFQESCRRTIPSNRRERALYQLAL